MLFTIKKPLPLLIKIGHEFMQLMPNLNMQDLIHFSNDPNPILCTTALIVSTQTSIEDLLHHIAFKNAKQIRDTVKWLKFYIRHSYLSIRRQTQIKLTVILYANTTNTKLQHLHSGVPMICFRG